MRSRRDLDQITDRAAPHALSCPLWRLTSGRHNIRDMDTVAQMTPVVMGLIGGRLLYRELVAKT